MEISAGPGNENFCRHKPNFPLSKNKSLQQVSMTSAILFFLYLLSFASGLTPMYGQFCGPGGTRGLPRTASLDLVDGICWDHDTCWDKRGNFNLFCDRELVMGMVKVLGDPSVSGFGRLFGSAAAAYFSFTPIQYIAAVQKVLSLALPSKEIGQINVPYTTPDGEQVSLYFSYFGS
jgi:hypothetical protein